MSGLRSERLALDYILELIREPCAGQFSVPSCGPNAGLGEGLQNEFLWDLDRLPYPAFDLYASAEFICISTSRGCPFRCPYCASSLLSGRFKRREPENVLREIEYWTSRFRVSNVVFYDDALLLDSYNYILPILKQMIGRGIHCNLHAPNALHAREIDGEVARHLFLAGFKTIRLGFETSDPVNQTEMGGKVNNTWLLTAIRHLREAGYACHDIGVYVMAGLPGQRAEEVWESIAFVREAGARPLLAEYSPIPGTGLFERARDISPFDIQNEPLYQNNSILPCQWQGFTTTDLRRIKESLRYRQ